MQNGYFGELSVDLGQRKQIFQEMPSDKEAAKQLILCYGPVERAA